MVRAWTGISVFLLLATGQVGWGKAPIPTETTELFAAVKAGDIEVKFIPRDEKVGTVIVTNKTDRPLSIKVPEALAAVPVAAQFGQGLFGGGNNLLGNGNNNGNNGGNQALGGAMRNPGGPQNVGGPGFFNVPAERAVKLKFNSVCLEHGKPAPNTRIPYELVPLDSYTDDAGVAEVVKMLSRRELEQPEAQAAAWHLANKLSWEKLAARIGARHLNGTSELMFTAGQIERARKGVAEAKRRASGSAESLGQSLTSR